MSDKMFVPRTKEELADEVERLKIEWPDVLPEHFSATQVGMMMRCPEQYRQRYLLGNKQRPGKGMMIGRADSQTIGHHLQLVLDKGERMSQEEIEDTYATAWAENLYEEGGATAIEWAKGETLPASRANKLADESKDLGIKLVTAYYKDVSPQLEPDVIAVEREIAMFDPVWPVAITGYLDVETDHTVVERKTTASKKSSIDPGWIPQGMLYAAATQKPVLWHQSVKTKTPYAEGDNPALTLPATSENTRRVRSMVSQSMRTVAHYTAVYGPDNPWPGALAHPWACGFCGYRDNCEWWT